MVEPTKSKDKDKCPFCGNAYEEEFSFVKRHIGFDAYAVTCSCGAQGPCEDTKELAIARWNRRSV
jgi:Lar family restriction alleviation protein